MGRTARGRDRDGDKTRFQTYIIPMITMETMTMMATAIEMIIADDEIAG